MCQIEARVGVRGGGGNHSMCSMGERSLLMQLSILVAPGVSLHLVVVVVVGGGGGGGGGGG